MGPQRHGEDGPWGPGLVPFALLVSVIVGMIAGLILGRVAALTLTQRIKRSRERILSSARRIILLAGLAALAPLIPVVGAGVLAMVFVWPGPLAWHCSLKTLAAA